jgi:hypothetical protein
VARQGASPRPWYYYAVMQHLAVCLTAIVVLIGVLVSLPEPSEPKVTHWRPATPAEEREYERQHLADLLDAMRPQE